MKYELAKLLVEHKAEIIGRRMTEDDSHAGEVDCGRVRDVVLRMEGDLHWFALVGENGVECGGAIEFLSVVARTVLFDSNHEDRNPAHEQAFARAGILIQSTFGMSWYVEPRPELRAVT